MRWPGLSTCMTLWAPGAPPVLAPPAAAVQQPAGQEEPAPEYLGHLVLLDAVVAALRADGVVLRERAGGPGAAREIRGALAPTPEEG